jgi:hypothetical protein
MIEAIGAILAAMFAGPLFKKKPYSIWLKVGVKWELRGTGSARRMRKAAKVFLELGIPVEDIVILPKGVTPP